MIPNTIMIPNIIAQEITCPICKRRLLVEFDANLLVPPKTRMALHAEKGHMVDLDATHYQCVDQLTLVVLIVVTHCPRRSLGDNK